MGGPWKPSRHPPFHLSSLWERKCLFLSKSHQLLSFLQSPSSIRDFSACYLKKKKKKVLSFLYRVPEQVQTSACWFPLLVGIIFTPQVIWTNTSLYCLTVLHFNRNRTWGFFVNIPPHISSAWWSSIELQATPSSVPGCQLTTSQSPVEFLTRIKGAGPGEAARSGVRGCRFGVLKLSFRPGLTPGSTFYKFCDLGWAT